MLNAVDASPWCSDDSARRPVEYEQTESHFTPLPVTAQIAVSLTSVCEPRSIGDLGAGAGGIGQTLATVWPHARRTAVELRRSEESFLHRHYQDVIIGDALSEDVRRRLTAVRPDLYIFNPPFSLTLKFVELALDTVAANGLVVVLTRQTWSDHEGVEAFLRARPPIAEITIGGRVSMSQAGRKCDQFGYQWLIWTERPSRRPWARDILPRLAHAQLGWVERPGTGSAAPAKRLDRDLTIDMRGLLGAPTVGAPIADHTTR